MTLLDALLARARKATEKRNDILHSFWGTEGDDPVVRNARHEYLDAPMPRELLGLANDLADIRADITHARLEGFLFLALKKSSLSRPKD